VKNLSYESDSPRHSGPGEGSDEQTYHNCHGPMGRYAVREIGEHDV
jgi:hypothetical protein